MASTATNLWVLLGLGLAGVLLMTRRLKKAIKADFGAFVERFELLPPPPPQPPKAPHALAGLSFAVADVFDVCGHVTGFGHPEWARTHDAAAAQTSTAVSVLVDGGATCVGKTVVDEFCCSIHGENKHYGTPTNPAAHDRIPGGCSSGSAVAVASGLVDFALGIDTIGGVRVPASFCGILGFRPSHGAVPNFGVIRVSQSLDNFGLFAKDSNILHRVAHGLLQLPIMASRQPRHIIFANDCFEISKISPNLSTQIVTKSTEKIFGKKLLNHIKLGDYLAPKVPSLKKLTSRHANGAVKTSFLESLGNAMLLLHKHEFRTNHREWLESVQLSADPVVSSQFNDLLESDSDIDIQCCQAARNETRLAINALLKDDGILVIPTVPGIPPKLGAKELMSMDYHIRTNSLLAIAGMSGCCQVTVPIGLHEKCPTSVSFVSRNGCDRFLLEAVKKLYDTIQEQAQLVAKTSSRGHISKEESAEIAKQKGNVAYKEKQCQKAITHYTEAIKLVGDNATYYNNRAAAYIELGSYLQAEADCTTAINLDKKNIKAYLRRGTAREMLAYYQEAIDDFKHALVLEPTNKTASVALSRLSKLFP